MADPKQGDSFLRKVVRFVANPTTDWADLNSRQSPPSELDLEKSELKAMIERKRRNDFVRKREFDLLRRVRREGLTPEQLAALGGFSRLDDSDARASEASARADGTVKAKIDEIEQQMVGSGGTVSARHAAGVSEAPTEPAAFPAARPTTGFGSAPSIVPDVGAERLRTADGEPLLPALPPLADPDRPPPGPAVMATGLPPLSAAAAAGIEFSEVQHDPELDEAVIAFANADFDACEHSLEALTAPDGPRARHVETWLVRFDLYRATGQQAKFEALAVDYVQRFGWSAPQWFSLPQLVAQAAADEKPRATAGAEAGPVGWACPPVLDLDAVARLRAQTLQMPLPWVLDWSALQSVDAEAAAQLTELLRQWSAQPIEMRWQAGDRLLAVLAEQAPTGARDADPAFWTARLEVLRLAHRPDQFDEAAIDFCVTFEVSPPSWERSACKLRLIGPGQHTHSPALSRISEVSTTFGESSIDDLGGDGSGPGTASVDLAGQLVGSIDEILTRLDDQLGTASLVNVSCARLIRVDFLAAGDLLNWVLARRNEGRQVSFSDAHRLVALFFGAMGINEHARVRVRHV